MAPRARTIKVNLYCPSMSLDISNHHINISHSTQVILEKIGGALQTSRPCFAYTTKREPISDFSTLKSDQHVLVATSYFDRVLDDMKRQAKIVQEGVAEEKWIGLPAVLKRDVVEGLRRDDRRKRDGSDEIIYLTLPFRVASARLDDVTESCSKAASSKSSKALSKSDAPAFPSAEECLATMQENWDAPIEAALGFQGMVMPYGDMEGWEDGLIAMLAVLSEATVGQVDVVATLIVEEVKKRTGGARGGGMVVELADVRSVGEELFRRGL